MYCGQSAAGVAAEATGTADVPRTTDAAATTSAANFHERIVLTSIRSPRRRAVPRVGAAPWVWAAVPPTALLPVPFRRAVSAPIWIAPHTEVVDAPGRGASAAACECYLPFQAAFGVERNRHRDG